MKKSILKDISKDEHVFLQESNYIEGECSEVAEEDAILAWKFLRDVDEINMHNLLEAHRLLARRIDPNIAGKLRRCKVWIGGREGAEWEDVPGLLDKLFQRKVPKTWRGIKKWHVDYERIHPFRDINGRSGRLILLWQNVRAGLPIKIIHSGKEQYAYYKWFSKNI